MTVAFSGPPEGGQPSETWRDGSEAPAGPVGRWSIDWSASPYDICWEACPRDGFYGRLTTRRGDWETCLCAEHAVELETRAERDRSWRPGDLDQPWRRVEVDDDA